MVYNHTISMEIEGVIDMYFDDILSDIRQKMNDLSLLDEKIKQLNSISSDDVQFYEKYAQAMKDWRITDDSSNNTKTNSLIKK